MTKQVFLPRLGKWDKIFLSINLIIELHTVYCHSPVSQLTITWRVFHVEVFY